MQRYAGAQEHHGRLVLALQFTYLFWHWRRPLYVRFVRTYLVLMYTGFTLYLIYPMAPPWWAGDLGRIRQIAPILSLVHWKGIGDPVGILTATFQPDPVTAMPSMHAAFSMLVWLVLWRMWPRRGWIAVLYPLAMATTVLYTGDHYVIDIFVGWLFALVAFTVVWRPGRNVSSATAPGTADKYEVRDPVREITVRDLLMHISGLVGAGEATVVGQLYQKAELRGSSSAGTLADMIAKVGRLPLHCEPGSQWNYGISTDLVGYLCEVISGTRFDRFVEERICAPLGMKDTGFQVPESEVGRFAANYRRGDTPEPSYVLIDRPDSSSPYTKRRTYFSGAGGMVSTAADYLRFCMMLRNGGELDGARILGPRTLQFMTMNHLPGGRDLAGLGGRLGETTLHGIGFGLGFAVLLDPTVAQVLGTPGEYYWGGAASTAFFVSPREDLIMIFLTQLMPSSSYPFRREIRATIYSSIIE